MKKILLSFVLLAGAVISLPAREVSGTVKCGKEKLSGVIVTDGKGFTRTDKKGRFKFDADDKADFIFIVTPSGYVTSCESGTPEFYIPASHQGKFDFELSRTSDSRDYSFIAMADTQTSKDWHFEKFQRVAVPELVNTFAEQSQKFNTFGMVLGDICWDRQSLFPKFKEEFKKFGVPFYPVIGNHDHQRELTGDHECSAAYREYFGPENYAFSVGGDYFIMLDAILYKSAKKYGEGYTDATVDWVRRLVEMIPEDASVIIAQHPVMQQRYVANSLLENAEKLFDAVGNHDTHILCGHTHVNNNVQYRENILQLNIAAICSAWWDTYYCKDGTPGGYKVFEKKDGKLIWYYKPLGKSKDYQVEIYGLGRSFLHPNAVVANVWDYDDCWKVEWFEDGKPMGSMKRVSEYSPKYIAEVDSVFLSRGSKVSDYKRAAVSNHYFIAVPSQYAKKIEVVVTDRFGNVFRHDYDMDSYVDVQAHRGGAGLMPENTIQAMQRALDLGVNTLELDLQVCGDGQVVVSHDAYFHSRYATRPDGSVVKKEEPKEYIYHMPYDSVMKYDTGIRSSEVWPEKECIPAYKPLAYELIDFVESYTVDKGITPVRYNVEIKSREGKNEGKNWPEYHEFVDKCVQVLNDFDLGDRLVIQSFDVRALNYMHEKYPDLHLSYLIDETDVDFEKTMSLLNFVPEWISPHYSIVNEEFVKKAKASGMKIVPWTADDTDDIRRLVELKVEAIISNYPDRVLRITRGYIDNKTE